MSSIIDLVREIAKVKKEVVFVGSLCLWNLKLLTDPHDIDIVVKDLEGLELFGKAEIWETKSPMSISGKRACIRREDYTIDIFIESVLPDFTLTDGIKFQTLENLKKHIELVIDSSEGEFKNRMIEKKKKYSFN